ncbi:unnamed protein product [Polarella glacialis]|uniref:Uncharacterized protein n=1 Tax=Polarella glacialis TaxID=89957 RepID=A0A813F8G9_POLGL|nr:unnamed protein product [Polarella glacialis]CAE8645720.1 unnamed protein product [Polarella glacialis]
MKFRIRQLRGNGGRGGLAKRLPTACAVFELNRESRSTHGDSRFNSKTAAVEEFTSKLEFYTSEHSRKIQNSLDSTAQSTPPRQLTGKDRHSRFNSKTSKRLAVATAGTEAAVKNLWQSTLTAKPGWQTLIHQLCRVGACSQ